MAQHGALVLKQSPRGTGVLSTCRRLHSSAGCSPAFGQGRGGQLAALGGGDGPALGVELAIVADASLLVGNLGAVELGWGEGVEAKDVVQQGVKRGVAGGHVHAHPLEQLLGPEPGQLPLHVPPGGGPEVVQEGEEASRALRIALAPHELGEELDALPVPNRARRRASRVEAAAQERYGLVHEPFVDHLVAASVDNAVEMVAVGHEEEAAKIVVKRLRRQGAVLQRE
mmetsp:Transcript_9536/g.16444  ORF Transcript_9536/g.16444 Transcript_9536/m.16444 type:complete len:227 (-) Transcript_9536:28-708(-)